MVQIIEVLIAVVISAMMATAISTLALSPIKTQRQKSVYAASEAAAIAVRKCVVDNSSSMPTITAANVNSVCAVSFLDVECSVKIPYTPPGTTDSFPHAVVCKPTGAAADSSGQAWQPIYIYKPPSP